MGRVPVAGRQGIAGTWTSPRRAGTHKAKLGAERFLAPEILFNPELVGQEYPGVHQVGAVPRDGLPFTEILGDRRLNQQGRSRPAKVAL